MDVWRAGAPRIDILGVDAYGEFAEPYAKYNRSGNPLFVPESRGGPEGAARVLYAFGRHDAIGFSSSGIDGPMTPDNDLMSSYDLIAQLAPLIAEHQGKGTMSAVLLRGRPTRLRKSRWGITRWRSRSWVPGPYLGNHHRRKTNRPRRQFS